MKKAKKVKKQAAPEKRLYVIVAESVVVDGNAIYLETGRMAAQACHVTAKFREGRDYEDITTIILTARSNKELKMLDTWLEHECIELFLFADHNPAFYETEDRVLTALCIYAFPDDAEVVIGHLELM